MLLTKTNHKEFLESFRRDYPPFVPVNELIKITKMPDHLTKPWWVDLAVEQKKQRALQNKQLRKSQPRLKSIFRFVDENSLTYLKLNDYQHRVINRKTGKYVEWWDGKKQTMRRLDGQIDWQGENKITLHQELARLV